MSRLGEHYAPRYLSGELSLDYVASKLKSASTKQQFCEWLVSRMIYSDIRAGDCYPPVEELPAELYPAVQRLLGHSYLSRYASRLIFAEFESSSGSPFELLTALCEHQDSTVTSLVSHIDVASSPKSASALFRLLSSKEPSIWIQAAKTTRTRTKLYQFTQWPAVLDQISRRQRGQILEEELGL